MCWECNNIYYQVQGIDDIFTKKVTTDELKPYIEPKMKDDKATGSRIDFSLTERIELDLGNTHEVIVENGKTFVVRKKPTYPKTYKECFNVCFGNKHHIIQVVGLDGDNKELFESFIKLKICRDAYWKLYGEEMGLGKPWEPDFNSGQFIPAIIYRGGFIQKVEVQYINTILAFPTTEMREAFFENFKKEIEQCKELL
jgi:hypothetical protein